MKITSQKINEKDALKLYSNLINNMRNNILNVLENLESVFTRVYLNYSDKPSESQESIAERPKL